MKRFLSFLCLLFSPALISGEEAVLHVNPDGAAQLMEKGDVTVIDVRTPAEYQEGHIKGSKNIDFRSPTFAAELTKLDKTTPYLIHCQSGGRSTRALEVFRNLGFQKVHHLDEGFAAWVDGGKPVEK